MSSPQRAAQDGISAFPTLASIDREALVDARCALHWAVGVVAAVGSRLAAAEADWVQLALSRRALERDFVTRPAPTAPPVRAALAPSTGELRLVDPKGATLATQLLAGRTLAQARTWLADELTARGAPAFEPEENDELPAHPFGAGAPFRVDARASRALDALFAAAHAQLSRAARTHGGTPEPRLWPHHFDLDVLVPMTAAGVGEKDPRVGLGFSPGDAANALPYFYGTFAFASAPPVLPPLSGGGAWNTDGWLGAVLPIEALRAGDEATQVAAFLDSAVEAGRALVRT